MSTETFGVICIIVASISWYLKIRYHLIYLYNKKGEPYPGFFNGLIELPFYKAPFIGLPIPILESKASFKKARPVLITSIITIICLIIFVGVSKTVA